jgi:hypothetical protein
MTASAERPNESVKAQSAVRSLSVKMLVKLPKWTELAVTPSGNRFYITKVWDNPKTRTKTAN